VLDSEWTTPLTQSHPGQRLWKEGHLDPSWFTTAASLDNDVRRDALDVLKVGHPQWWTQRHPRRIWLPRAWQPDGVRLPFGRREASPVARGPVEPVAFSREEWSNALCESQTASYQARTAKGRQLAQLRSLPLRVLWKQLAIATHRQVNSCRKSTTLTHEWLVANGCTEGGPATSEEQPDAPEVPSEEQDTLVEALLTQQLLKLGVAPDGQQLETAGSVEAWLEQQEDGESETEKKELDMRTLRSLRYQ
jgi:hypothetical protein